jgi:hypothetical protein
MIGDRAQPGIMVLTLRDLFKNSDRVKAKQRLSIKVRAGHPTRLCKHFTR